MSQPDKRLLDWLRDAHAMEQQAEQMLRAQSGRLEHYPRLKARIDQHLDETLGKQTVVAGCIERLRGTTSTGKDLAGKMMAFAQAAGGMTMTDEVVKGAVMSYVFENLEIASYTSLIAAATRCDDTETVAACERILPQEQAMAQWLLEHIPSISIEYLDRSAAGQEAKK